MKLIFQFPVEGNNIGWNMLFSIYNCHVKKTIFFPAFFVSFFWDGLAIVLTLTLSFEASMCIICARCAQACVWEAWWFQNDEFLSVSIKLNLNQTPQPPSQKKENENFPVFLRRYMPAYKFKMQKKLKECTSQDVTPRLDSRWKYKNSFYVSGTPGRHRWLQSWMLERLPAYMDGWQSIQNPEKMVIFKKVTGVFLCSIISSTTEFFSR